MGLLIKAFIMGVVEGLTEFLPVSSTGHMIIVGDFIDFKGESFHTMFEIVIQLGAILAVIFYYRDKIIDSLRHLRPGERGFELWFKIFIAFLPSAVIGLLLDDLIEEYLFSSFTVAIALIGGGFLMIFAENLFGRWGMDDMDKTDIRQALTIGVGQCLALIPGMSRSASTIMGGMVAGLSTKAAAEFSFFLAIPTMIAASSYSLIKGFSGMTPIQWQALGIGFVVSFFVALLAVDRFLSFLKNHSLKFFAYYRILIGIAMAVLITSGVL